MKSSIKYNEPNNFFLRKNIVIVVYDGMKWTECVINISINSVSVCMLFVFHVIGDNWRWSVVHFFFFWIAHTHYFVSAYILNLHHSKNESIFFFEKKMKMKMKREINEGKMGEFHTKNHRHRQFTFFHFSCTVKWNFVS